MTSKKISRILQWKGVVKEQMSIEMRKAREKLQAEMGKLDGLNAKLAENMAIMDGIQSGPSPDAGKLELLSNYIIYLDKGIKEQERKVSEIMKEVDAKQGALRNAYREERVFETLRNRIAGEELREKECLEQKEMDFNTVVRRVNK
ncbi:MAG: flagellar export protein FliJ [Nitrospiraceae bacterium]|nr:flagellar export protein FliJ [Nitrospiraceae bacterium]